MDIDVLCGEQHINLNLPEDSVVLDPTTVLALADPLTAIKDAISNPIESAPLSELAKNKKDACIVISDVTRPVPNATLLPPILSRLEESGIPRNKIKILIATGMHRPNEGKELEGMVGRNIMENYTVINHFCRKEEDLRLIETIDGAPIEINKHYLDADLKILTGLIEPHMYAGYSGGRKSILPGISSFTTMTHMHSFKMIDQSGVTNFKLGGNPFHEAGKKVCEIAGVDFIANVVINKEREMIGIFAGHYDKAHLAGCKMVKELASKEISEEVDLVVTSAGGYPLDATFYQVSKGLIAARNIVRKEGSIIVACECREGLGSEKYTEMILEGNTPVQFFEKYSDPDKFEIDQWCLQTTYQTLDHAGKIYVFSPFLSESELGAMGMIKIDDIQTAVNMLQKDHQKIAVAPEGPYVVGLLNQAANIEKKVQMQG